MTSFTTVDVSPTNLQEGSHEADNRFQPRFAEPQRLDIKEYQKSMAIERASETPADSLYLTKWPERASDATTTRPREKRPLPTNWHIPAEFPYTHTHIAELGDWPQRLLHVESMTSYEWQPGNIYNGHKEPAYRGVSYTWGRWRLADDAPAQLALPISGVPWAIPRIDPAHFSAAELAATLRRTCGIQPTVDFIWLDVACIDQRPGLAALREVGRQAGIFRRAESVAVWLAQTGRGGASHQLSRRLGLLERSACLLRSARASAEQEEQDRRVLLRFDGAAQAEVLVGVKEMLCDQWFTGLWTLQEGFLANRSFFLLAGDGLRVERTAGAALYTLAGFADSCRLVLRYGLHKEWFATYDGVDDFLNELRPLVQKSGLSAMARDGNPLNLLTIARHRSATVDEDNVYGIVQVFGYRLGSMRLDAHADEHFGRAALELQLGATLLSDRQAQSQLFVFLEPPDQGQGWRISGSAHVHHDFHELFEWASPNKATQDVCVLSTRQVGQVTYGHFHGRLAAFTEVNKALNTLEDRILEDTNRTPEEWNAPFFRSFYPDVSPLFTDSVEYRSPMYIPRDRARHRAFGTYLQDRFGGNHLVVLYLGCCSGRHLGLLLLYVEAGGVSYWHRLGIVMWCLGNVSPPLEQVSAGPALLDGTEINWQTATGIYG